MLKRLAAASVLAAAFVAPAPAQADTCGPFTDVDAAQSFCADVLWMRNRGITQGCSATQYCPNSGVTRAQMAIFLRRMAASLAPAGVYHVSPTNADYTTVQSAIDAAAAVATQTAQKLVRVGPGWYVEQVTLKDNVSLEGAGLGVTVLRNPGTGPTVLGGAASAVRNLTVLNVQGGSEPAIAVDIGTTSAEGFTLLRDVDLQAEGAEQTITLRVTAGGVTFEGRSIAAAGVASASSTGILVSGPTASLRMRGGIVGDNSLSPLRRAIVAQNGAVANVAHAQLLQTTQGNVVCIGVYDAVFAPRACQ